MATDYVSLCQGYEEANKRLKDRLRLAPEDKNIQQEIEENEKQLKVLRGKISLPPEQKRKAPLNAAPTLHWNYDKWNNKGTYSKDRKAGYYFYQLPVPIMDYINETLDGKNGLLLKIMMVLIGTDEGFGISEKWICDRIGLNGREKARSYYKARDDLHNMRWIYYDKEEKTITLNYDLLWDEAFTEKERRMPVLEFRKNPELYYNYVSSGGAESHIQH